MLATSFEDPPAIAPSCGTSEAELAPRILIVDDQPLTRDLVARILKAEGFRTAVATDACEALETLRSGAFDLVLLDVRLPGGDGFELCRAMKMDRTLSAIPVIFLSSLDDPSDRMQGFDVGGVDYITKPFEGEEVLARVRIHLRLERALRSLAGQQEMRLAELRDAQRSILVMPEDLPDALFAVCYRPLGAVGGDIYDVLRVGDGLYGYLVGDISGHGVGASFLTSAVKALLRQYSAPLYTAEDTMRGINLVMKSILKDGQFLTACYMRYCREKALISVVSAGHPAPVWIRPGAKPTTFPVASEPLGLFESVVLTKRDIRVEPGDRIYLYTDGLIEDPGLPGGGRGIGVDRLLRSCEMHHGLALAEAVGTIAEDVRPAGGSAVDDLLLLGMEVPS